MVREQRKARNAHFCEMCGRLIYPGMDYIWQNALATKGRQQRGERIENSPPAGLDREGGQDCYCGKKKGWHWTTKMHLHCDALQQEAEKHLKSGQYCYSADVRHWIEDNACVNCPLESDCPEDEVYSCRNALSLILPERYLPAATKSAMDLRTKEKL